MCDRRAMAWKKMSDLEYYYSAKYSAEVDGMVEGDGNWLPIYHVAGRSHAYSPVITSRDPGKIQLFSCGLIPHTMPSLAAALERRKITTMCRSEEMYEKDSYKILANKGKRCLIPSSGYFEYQWQDEEGKRKIPYYIYLYGREFFSIGGLYSNWVDPVSKRAIPTFSVCTTEANLFTAKIHNHGKRMPVILLNREAEKAWLDPALSKQDVLALCKPIPSSLMVAHTVSKTLTSKVNNVPDAILPYNYPGVEKVLALAL